MVVVILGDGKMKLIAVSPYEMTFVMARGRNNDVALEPDGADGETIGGAVVVRISVEVSVLCETVEELENGVLGPGLVGVLPLNSAEEDEIRLVLEVNEATLVFDEDESRFVLEDEEDRLVLEDDIFTLGTRVTKVVDEIGTTLGGVTLDELDNWSELDAEMRLDGDTELADDIELADGRELDDIEFIDEVELTDAMELDDERELEVTFSLNEDVADGGIPGVEPAAAEDVVDDEETLLVVEDGNDVRAGDDVTERLALLDRPRFGVVKLELLDKVLTKVDDPTLGVVKTGKEDVRLGETVVDIEDDGTKGPGDDALKLLDRGVVEIGGLPLLANEPLVLAVEGDRDEVTSGEEDTGDESLELRKEEEEVESTLLGSVGDSELTVDGDTKLSEERDTSADDIELGVAVGAKSDVRVDDILEAVEVSGAVEGSGKDTVNPSLIGVDELEATDDDSVDNVELEVEFNVGTVGCTLRLVVVGVVKTLELLGKAGLVVAPEEAGTGVLTVAKVLVMTVGEPLGRVLVNVVVKLEAGGRVSPEDEDGNNTPGKVGDVLTTLVAGPPGAVLLRVDGMPDVVGLVGPEDNTGGAPLTVVVSVLVSMVVDPPGMVLVIVISTVEVIMDGMLGLINGSETIGEVPDVVIYGIDDGTIVVSKVEIVAERPLLIITTLVGTNEEGADG